MTTGDDRPEHPTRDELRDEVIRVMEEQYEEVVLERDRQRQLTEDALLSAGAWQAQCQEVESQLAEIEDAVGTVPYADPTLPLAENIRGIVAALARSQAAAEVQTAIRHGQVRSIVLEARDRQRRQGESDLMLSRWVSEGLHAALERAAKATAPGGGVMTDEKSCMRCGQPVIVPLDGWRNGNAYCHADMAICIRALGDAVKRLEQVALPPPGTIPGLGMHIDTVQTAEMDRGAEMRPLLGGDGGGIVPIRADMEMEYLMSLPDEILRYVFDGLTDEHQDKLRWVTALAQPATGTTVTLTREQADEIRDVAVTMLMSDPRTGAYMDGMRSRLRKALEPLNRS